MSEYQLHVVTHISMGLYCAVWTMMKTKMKTKTNKKMKMDDGRWKMEEGRLFHGYFLPHPLLL